MKISALPIIFTSKLGKTLIFCAEKPKTHTGRGFQHERVCGFLLVDRCFDWIRIFKNI